MDQDTINKIAAGEVIERPASAVKELIENSLDANATRILIEVLNGGSEMIRVKDDGCGMEANEVTLAFERHATSKITTADDLTKVQTLGFRGEALPSIASISRSVEVITRPRTSNTGTQVIFEDGKLTKCREVGCPVGTSITVHGLFDNVPARKKHLSSPKTELSRIVSLIEEMAIIDHRVSFEIFSNRKTIFKSARSDSWDEVLIRILGGDTVRDLIPFRSSGPGFQVSGLVSGHRAYKSSTDSIYIYVNKRPVTSRMIIRSLRDALRTYHPSGRFPIAVISITMDPSMIDVNVHPTKREVRFLKEGDLSQSIETAIVSALHSSMIDSSKVQVVGTNVSKPITVGEQSTLPLESDRVLSTNHPDLCLQISSSDISTMVTRDDGPSTVSGPEDKTTDEEMVSVQNEDDLIDSELCGRSDSLSDELRSGSHSSAQSSSNTPSSSIPAEMRMQDVQPSKVSQIGTYLAQADPSKAYPIGSNVSDLHTSGTSGTRRLKLNIIGQAADLFIIGETNEGLVLIDQHAAAERIRYEALLKRFSAGVMAQELINPITIDLSPKEIVMMESYKDLLKEMGFDLVPFGGRTYKVRTLPVTGYRLEKPEAVHEILSEIFSGGKVSVDSTARDDILKLLACRGSIKAGKSLSHDEMVRLINELSYCENPKTCPHGRPIMVTISYANLSKMFGRS